MLLTLAIIVTEYGKGSTYKHNTIIDMINGQNVYDKQVKSINSDLTSSYDQRLLSTTNQHEFKHVYTHYILCIMR
jgi:bifunctional ADP-heptose synthase (sugar kinase/adenylyltransferase)